MQPVCAPAPPTLEERRRALRTADRVLVEIEKFRSAAIATALRTKLGFGHVGRPMSHLPTPENAAPAGSQVPEQETRSFPLADDDRPETAADVGIDCPQCLGGFLRA